MNERYLLKQFELQHKRLVNEAQQAQLRREVILAARRQNQVNRAAAGSILLNIVRALRGRLAPSSDSVYVQDCAGMESSTS